MSIPVISFHIYKGQDYPQQFVRSCQILGIKPFVIGNHKWDGAENVLHYDQSDCVRKLRENYTHSSTCEPWFELLCFERWFYIRELVRQQSISKFMHVDSDVLVLAKPDNLLNYPRSDVLATRCANSGTYTLGQCVMTAGALEVLCEHLEHHAITNDMARFSDLVTDGTLSVFDMALPVTSTVMDHHVGDVSRWESVESEYNGLKRKKLLMGDGLCYAIHSVLGPVRLLNLHCWYHFKHKMEQWLNRIYA